MGWEVDAISAKTNSTSGYEAERQKQSLLDFLESRVMKRKSINHCEKRPEMERWSGLPKAAGTAVWIFRETHAISAMASSTTGYELSRAETPQTFLRFCLCLYLPQ